MTHASHMTLSPFGPGTAPCTGLTEIPFLETGKERAFAFSSGECDVMSLVSGQVGRDQPRWAPSSATGLAVAGRAPGDTSRGGHIQAGGRAVKNKQADKWQEEEATSRVPTALPGEGRAAVGQRVLRSEPSTGPGSDPNPAMLARSVPSQATPAPHCPGHSLLLPSQLAAGARQSRFCAHGSLRSRRAPGAELAVSPPGVERLRRAGGSGGSAERSAAARSGALSRAQPGGKQPLGSSSRRIPPRPLPSRPRVASR